MSRDTGVDFWSRRRAAVAAETEAEALSRESEARQAEERRLDERSDEEILAELNLPAPEEMRDTEQVQTLLRSAIPHRLRNRALRRLWRLNPIFSQVDGLVDYGVDYTDAATVIPDMKTIYMVGKGMFDKFAEAEQHAALAPETENPPVPEEEASAEVAEEVARKAETAQDDPAPAPEPEPVSALEEPDDNIPEHAAPRPSRRMRFRFDNVT